MKWKHLAIGLLSFAACRSTAQDNPQPVYHPSPDAGTVTTTTPDASVSTGQGGSIKELFASPPGPDEVIELKDLVVVGLVKSSSRVSLYVQDKGGGPSSGIQIYCPKNGCDQYSDLGDVTRGEVVDVSAKYTVYKGEPELQFATVTRKGTTATPTFVEVDPAELAAGVDTASDAFKPWIGAAVKVKGPIAVTDVTADVFKTTCPNKNPGDFYSGFAAKAGDVDLNIGLSLYNVVNWCVPNTCDLECTQPVTEEMTFTQVEGVVRALNGNASVDPYLPEDLATGGEQPGPDAGVSEPDASIGEPDASVGEPDASVGEPDAPVGEPDAAGESDASTTSTTSIAALTIAPPADDTPVALDSVVVVGVELRSKGAQVYVQDRGGGPYSGLLIYCNSLTCKPLLASLQPGDMISVSGSFQTYASNGGQTFEIGEPLTVTAKGLWTAPVAIDVPAALLADTPDAPDFAPFNGVYVRVNEPAVVTTDHVAEFDSGSCSGDLKYTNAFQVSAGGTSGYVYDFFNTNLSLCVAGGCASCYRPVATGQHFLFLRGVLQSQTYRPAGDAATAKVVLAPVEDLDAPAPGSVRALLDAPPAPGTAITLTGVVTVAHNAVVGSKSANLFVQDPGGGRYSGIQIYCDKTKTGAGTCVDDILALLPGDVVDISGTYDLYQNMTPEILVPTAIVKADQTIDPVYAWAPPADVSADSGTVDGLSVTNHFAPYNQVLVKLDGPAPVAAVAVEDLYSSCGIGLDDWKGFSVLVEDATIYVGDLFNAAGMALCSTDQCDNADCSVANQVVPTDTFDFVEGIARFSKNSKVQIAPRSMADIPRTPQ